MEIGQSVRFLNEVGGGRIAGFEGKDIVLVEDADGFEIPMLRSEVVVIETNENNFVRKPKQAAAAPKPESTAAKAYSAADGLKAAGVAKTGSSLKAALAANLDAEEAETDTADAEITFRPRPKERRGGELLNVYLAFVEDTSHRADGVRFEAYLVNDSNYFLSTLFATAENAAWHALFQGTLEPNTKMRLHQFDRSDLPQLEHLSVSLFAWKTDKPYAQKPALTVELRLDTVKFYKLHVFQDTPFFHTPALIYDIVRDDRPKGVSEQIDVERLRDAISTVAPVQEETEEAEAKPQEVSDRKSDREALKAAKRALRQEREAAKQERDPHVSKPHHRPSDDGILEVDLHINALIDNITGLSPSVILNTQLTEFRIIMDRNIKRKGQRIVFIHGKGEGVLREALIKELRHRYRTCTYEDASFQQYGFGATMVTIH